MVLMVGLDSPDGRYDDIYLSNYATTQIKDVLGRVEGVGKVNIFGAKDFGMRVWLDPGRLKARNLTTDEVVAALREQNVQVAAGKIGEPPVGHRAPTSSTPSPPSGACPTSSSSRTSSSRAAPRESSCGSATWPGSSSGPRATPGTPSSTASRPPSWASTSSPAPTPSRSRRGSWRRWRTSPAPSPTACEWSIPYDTTEYIEASIAEVVESLIIAIVLVIFTVFIFLQDFRTTLIPAVTIPVSLIGTFAVMLAMGFSINNLTLFGLVLAIGIVVDDAIVVVENTMRLIDNEGLSAKEATAKAMDEVAGPVVATTLVLLAVFVPTTVMPGLTGRLYRQFAVTISVATVFSSTQRPHPEPGAVRPAAASFSREEGPLLHLVQPDVRGGRPSATRVPWAGCCARPRFCHWCSWACSPCPSSG